MSGTFDQICRNGERQCKVGIWHVVGIRNTSGEIYIGTEKGVIKVRTTRRKGTTEERWHLECMESMQGIPWEPVPGREGIEVKSHAVLPPAPADVPVAREFHDKAREWRRPKIETQDVVQDGVTQ